MIDLSRVRDGIVAASTFSTSLINDLDPSGGGFKGWQHDLSKADAEVLADYIVGSVQATGFGLQAAGTALFDYLDWRGRQDSAVKLNMTSHGKPYPIAADPRWHERELRMSLAINDAFVGCGSVLDGLVAAVIGVLGLRLDIHRASFRDFRPEASPHPYPESNKVLAKSLMPDISAGGDRQRGDLATFAATLAAAGPDGWHDWLSGMRNCALHRENRNQINDTSRTKQAGWVSQRMFASNPELSNLQGLRDGRDRLIDMHLHEDVRTTLEGCVESTNAVAVATIDMLERLWATRQAQPALIVQPAAQWASAPRGAIFLGYAPGTAEIGERSSIHAHPLDVHRLRASGMLK